MDERKEFLLLTRKLQEKNFQHLELIGIGTNGMVFSGEHSSYGTQRVAIKITRTGEINKSFQQRCWNEYQVAAYMASIGVGIPIYHYEWIGEHAIIIMALAEPVTSRTVLDQAYFYSIFQKILRMNQHNIWCADLKYINTVKYNNEYYLIDFDQEFCETTNNNFWNQVKTIIRHYKLPFPEPLNYYHPFGLQNDYNEFHHRFLAECYIFYKYAEQFNKANKSPEGYIYAINVIFHPPQGETKVESLPTFVGARIRF